MRREQFRNMKHLSFCYVGFAGYNISIYFPGNCFATQSLQTSPRLGLRLCVS